MATKKRRRFAEGGISDTADKEAGLKASQGEKVGFFERLRMGNIDDPSSEAYRRFGAGRGKAERTPVEDAVATPVSRSAAPEVDELEAADIRHRENPIEVSAGPKAEKSRTKTQAAKPSASAKSTSKTQEQGYRRSSGATAEEIANYKPPVSSKYPDIRGSAQDSVTAETRRRVKEGAQAVERVTPETAMLPGGSLKALSSLAKKLATPKMAKYSQEALPAPTKRLTYDKAGAVSRARASRAAARQEEMLAENASRYGLNPNSPGYEAAASAVRKELGGKDFSFKRGGKVKKASMPVKKMASGGMTSKASSRGDGIAQRGKTRGRIY
jgi:hypothetical protein